MGVQLVAVDKGLITPLSVTVFATLLASVAFWQPATGNFFTFGLLQNWVHSSAC